MSRQNRTPRRGSALAEGLLVIIPFTLFILALVELGLAVMRANSLSAAARYGARQAALHGEFAPPAGSGWSGPWHPAGPYPGSNPYTVMADQNVPIANAIRPYLVGFRGQDVRITVQWMDPDTHTLVPNNRVGTHVWVRIEGQHPSVTNLLGVSTINMGSSSTSIIEH